MMQHITNRSHHPISLTNKIRLDAYEVRDIDIDITEEIKRLADMGIIGISAAQKTSPAYTNNAEAAFKAEANRIKQLRLERRIKGTAENETVVDNAKTEKAPTRASANNSTSTNKGK